MIASINYQGRGIRPLETEQPAALDGSVVKISGSESTPPENFKFDSASGRVPPLTYGQLRHSGRSIPPLITSHVPGQRSNIYRYRGPRSREPPQAPPRTTQTYPNNK